MKNLLIIPLIFVTLYGFSQDIRTDDQKDDSWVNKLTLGLRKSYVASSREEDKPASFFFNRDFSNNVNFLTVDAALKISEITNSKNAGEFRYFIYPKIEWHRNTQEKNLKNSWRGGINLEIYPVAYKVNEMSDGWKLAPWIQGTIDFQDDIIKNLQTINYNVYLSLYSSAPFLPGGKLRDNETNIIFRYFVYGGYENYVSTKESALSSSYATGRVFGEAWPIPGGNRQYVQFTVEYVKRFSLSDNLYNLEDLDWFTGGINFYPTGNSDVGIGLEYSKGNDPTNSFVDTGRIIFGINLKI